MVWAVACSSGSACGECKDTAVEKLKQWKLLFLLCSSKKSESLRYSLFVLVLYCRGFVELTGVSF